MLDNHLGCCVYFVIYDNETDVIEFCSNPNHEKLQYDVPDLVEMLASREVHKIDSGEFGEKVKESFGILKIQLIIVSDIKPVSDIIGLLIRK